MAAKYSPVRVQFVQHYKFEVLKKPAPFSVMRQDAPVEHIGIAENDMTMRAYRRPRVLRRIAIVGIDTNTACAKRVCPAHEVVQLIVGEGLGGVEVERSRIRFFEDALKHGQVVAKGFTRSRGRDNHHILAAA